MNEQPLTGFVDLAGVKERLIAIFGAVGQQDVLNLTAQRTVFTMLYVRATNGVNPIRPTTVAWMNDEFAAVTDEAVRARYHQCALAGRRQRDALAAELGFEPTVVWYADNSREGIRDDCLRNGLGPYGAVHRDRHIPTTSSKPTWTLAASFAKLFDVLLVGEELSAAVANWQQHHLTGVGRARVEAQRRHQVGVQGVPVELPDKSRVLLPAGDASVITRDVIELMAQRLLTQPAVIFVATSSVPIPAEFAGLALDPAVLPDIVLYDIEQDEFYFVEVVATDGVMTEHRRIEILAWAAANDIGPARCKFVTAFRSRRDGPLRKRLHELAWETAIWFADEPNKIIYLSELD